LQGPPSPTKSPNDFYYPGTSAAAPSSSSAPPPTFFSLPAVSPPYYSTPVDQGIPIQQQQPWGSSNNPASSGFRSTTPALALATGNGLPSLGISGNGGGVAVPADPAVPLAQPRVYSQIYRAEMKARLGSSVFITLTLTSILFILWSARLESPFGEPSSFFPLVS